ncbi:Sugar ABC transporter permease [[Mycoplasma] cavipharyngis]|uniref:carbohydrate ABC transporter permease n=1 Tax=[Mycoplasma] cavipharyngis TaxID=92757 RepID=UPI0037048CCF
MKQNLTSYLKTSAINITYWWYFVKLNLRKWFQKIFKKEVGLGVLEQRHSSWEVFLLIAPSILAIILFTIIPFIITVKLSFQQTDSALKVEDQTIGISNFTNLVYNAPFLNGVRNTLIYSITAVPISLFFSILIASAIVHVIRKFAKQTFLSIFFMPYITSAVAVAATFFYMFSDDGLFNLLLGTKVKWLTDFSNGSWTAFGAILIYGVWSNLAFQILILTTAMLSVEKTLFKSASIDGSSKLKQFFKITFPSINRSLTFLITIGVIGAIKVFPLALFNNDVNAANNVGGNTLLLLIYLYTSTGQNGQSGVVSIILFLLGIATSLTLNIVFRMVIKGFIKWSDYRVNTKINYLK